ncbi:hypothetical protein, partial [Actinomadura luteofluorescens]
MDKALRFLGMRYATAALMLVAVAALYGAATFSRPGVLVVNTSATLPAAVRLDRISVHFST